MVRFLDQILQGKDGQALLHCPPTPTPLACLLNPFFALPSTEHILYFYLVFTCPLSLLPRTPATDPYGGTSRLPDLKVVPVALHFK